MDRPKRTHATITLIDRTDPEHHAVSLRWTDPAIALDDFDLSPLGEVVAIYSDLLADPPRGWVVLKGKCQRRLKTNLFLR